jgi:hypothetical protein
MITVGSSDVGYTKVKRLMECQLMQAAFAYTGYSRQTSAVQAILQATKNQPLPISHWII